MTEKALFAARKKFLNDTVKYYSEDVKRRSVKDKVCRYRLNLKPNGKKCAIGRHIPDKNYSPSMDLGINNAVRCLIYNFPKALPSKIVSLGDCFLSEVQMLHDGNRNWNKNGLSTAGKERMNRIIKEIKP